MPYPVNGDVIYPRSTIDRKFIMNAKVTAFEPYVLNECEVTTGWTATSGAISLDTNYFVRGRSSIFLNGTAATSTATFTPTSNWNLRPFVGTSTGLPNGGLVKFYIGFSATVAVYRIRVVFTDGSARTATFAVNNFDTSLYLHGPLTNWQSTLQQLNIDLTKARDVNVAFDWSDVDSITFNFSSGTASQDYYLDYITIEPTAVLRNISMDHCDATTGWAAASGTLTAIAGPVPGISASCIRAQCTAGTNVTATKTIASPINISTYCGASSGRPTNNKRIGFRLYIRSLVSTNPTGYVTVIIGSDSSNYFTQRWNLLEFDLSAGDYTIGDQFIEFLVDINSCYMVGTPDLTAIDYISLVLDRGTTGGDWFFDEISFFSETLNTVYVGPGKLLYGDNSYTFSGQYVGATDLEDNYIVAVMDNAGTVTFTNVPIGTSLSNAQVPLACVYGGKLNVFSGIKETQKSKIIYSTNYDSLTNSLFFNCPLRALGLENTLRIAVHHSNPASIIQLWINGSMIDQSTTTDTTYGFERMFDLKTLNLSEPFTIRIENATLKSIAISGD